VTDDSTRRTLRFSLFLQGFAFLLLGAATLVRAVVLGWDTVTLFFAAGMIIIAAAAGWTLSRLREE